MKNSFVCVGYGIGANGRLTPELKRTRAAQRVRIANWRWPAAVRSSNFVRRKVHLVDRFRLQRQAQPKMTSATATVAAGDGSGTSAMLSTPVTSPKWSK